MLKKISELLKKYRELILYAVFGVLTTVVNIATYYICYTILGVPNVPSTIVAWFFAIVFAFVTNKIWVFDSKSWKGKVVVPEAVKFVVARLATGALDVGIMWIAVDVLAMNSLVWKIISNVIVIIVNYITSKLVVFKEK